MARTIQKKIKFSKGQIVPELVERTDLELYNASAQKMKNVVSSVYGGVRSRRGTKYIDYITKVEEDEPNSITSNIFSDTSHFTDLTTKTSNAIGSNRILAILDYGTNKQGSANINVKNIKINPYTVSYTTAGTHSQVIEGGEYEVEIVGAGGGGSYYTNYSEYAIGHTGGSGAFVHGTLSVPAGTYDIVVGAGGSSKQSGYYAWVATDGGDSSAFGQIAGGGKLSTSGGYANPGENGAGGTYTTTLTGQNGVAGGSTGYLGYGYGGYGKNSGCNGYVKIRQYQPCYTLIFSVSTDGTNYVYITDEIITETERDIDIILNYRYRYVKIELVSDAMIQSSVQLQYIRNNVSESLNNSIRLEKFVYNNIDKYLLVMLNEKIQVFKNDSLVQILTASGVLKSFLKDLKVSTKDDTMVLTHKEMHPKILKRTGTDTFTFGDLSIDNIPYASFSGEIETAKTTGITPSAEEGACKITADSSIFDSTWVGQYIDGNGGRFKITEYISGTVVNGYTTIPFYTKDKIKSWKYISGYEPVWSTTRGWPATCLFAQQRLWFGGSKGKQSTIWASRLGDYFNFKNSGNYDNDSIDVDLLTNDPILSLTEQRGIHVFTSGQEYTATEGTYTPDKFTIVKNTSNGTIGLQPVVVSGAILFVEKNGKSLLSYVYDDNQAAFVNNDLSMFSNLIQAPVAFDAEINSSKDKGDFLYLVLDDGKMLVCCVALDQDIMSITSFETDGKILDVCSLVDENYICVLRNGRTCLEKIVDDQTDSVEQRYVSGTQISGLYRQNEKYVYVYSDNTVYGKYKVNNNAITLTSTPNEVCKIGLAFDYEIEGNPIAINHQTDSIKKRITSAVVLCENTPLLKFCNQTKRSKNNYKFYSCTKYDYDVRYNIVGEFYPIQILSVQLNINYEG